MRLFIAINFGTDTRSRLLALRDELRSHSERGNFSLPENLHLTLAFLGECDAGQCDAAKNAMDALCLPPIELQIDKIRRFKREDGDIWWAGLHPGKALPDVQRDLTNKLNGAGFSLDKREYKPHITLGREVVTDTAPWHIEPFGETAAAIDLMKSERIRGKLTYTAVHRVVCREGVPRL